MYIRTLSLASQLVSHRARARRCAVLNDPAGEGWFRGLAARCAFQLAALDDPEWIGRLRPNRASARLLYDYTAEQIRGLGGNDQ
jgi:hypothetical protein